MNYEAMSDDELWDLAASGTDECPSALSRIMRAMDNGDSLFENFARDVRALEVRALEALDADFKIRGRCFCIAALRAVE